MMEGVPRVDMQRRRGQCTCCTTDRCGVSPRLAIGRGFVQTEERLDQVLDIHHVRSVSICLDAQLLSVGPDLGRTLFTRT